MVQQFRFMPGGAPADQQRAAGGTMQAQRRMALARALGSQAMDTSPVQSPYQALARVLAGYWGGQELAQADREDSARTANRNTTMSAAMAALSGRPAERQDLGGGDFINWNAQAPNEDRAISILSGNPDTAPAALSLMNERQQRQWKLAEALTKSGLRQASDGSVTAIPGYADAIGSIEAGKISATEGAKLPFTLATHEGKAAIDLRTKPALAKAEEDARVAASGQPLVEVYDPATGKSTWTPRSAAAGQSAPPPRPAAEVSLRQESKYDETRGKALAETYQKIIDGAAEAGRNLQQIERLDSILSGVETGTFTPQAVDIAKAVQAVGLDPARMGLPSTGTIGKAEAARALANEMALQLRNPAGGAGMPGALSDKDREFLVSMVPGLTTTPAGRKLILETMRAINGRALAVADAAEQHREKNGGRLTDGFYAEIRNLGSAIPDAIITQAQEIIRGGTAQDQVGTGAPPAPATADAIPPVPKNQAERVVGQRYRLPNGRVFEWSSKSDWLEVP